MTKPVSFAPLLISLLLFVACTPDSETELHGARQELTRLQSKIDGLEYRQSVTAKIANKGEPGVWALDWNDKEKIFVPRMVEPFPRHKAIPKNIVAGLNRIHSKPGVEFVAQRGATVHLRVKDDLFLTQRMGSAGARQYLGAVVMSLTSVPGVELVHLDFYEGDHASPGYYSRAMFIPAS